MDVGETVFSATTSAGTHLDLRGPSCGISLHEQAMDGMPCNVHKDNPSYSCTLPAEGDVDLLVACAPCQPYSQMRRRSNAPKPEEHPLHGVLQDSIVKLANLLKPQVFVTEQVMGFDGDPKVEFINSMMESGHFVASAVFQTNSSVYIQGNRPRRGVASGGHLIRHWYQLQSSPSPFLLLAHPFSLKLIVGNVT